MKKLEVFDPAMCCSSGVCGPSVDPELSRIASDLERVKGEGVEVTRHNLGQTPVSFVTNSEVAKLMEEKGTEILPITVVDGTVVKTGGYPAKEELESWLSG